jgi:hypothetical protein
VEQTIKESESVSEVCRKLGWKRQGNTVRKIKIFIEENNIDISHFRIHNQYTLGYKKPKWEKIEKICPICENTFTTSKGHPREKTTCSYSCANTYFRSGEDNPNWKEKRGHREVCFQHHKKKCIICEETLIVAVHHFDGDNKNNKPDNLIPICPTHHTYYHSGYRDMVEQKIIDYRNEWLKNGITGSNPVCPTNR